MKLPIPDDWNEETDGYILGLVCFPNSKLWRAIVRGQIQILSYGRFWDEQTGTIKDVQVIGRQIYESFMACKLDDLVTAVDNLNVTIAAQQETQEAIVTALGQIRTAIELTSPSVLENELIDIKTALEHIRTAVELTGGNEDLEDDLANVWSVLKSIDIVLGGTYASPPNPL